MRLVYETGGEGVFMRRLVMIGVIGVLVLGVGASYLMWDVWGSEGRDGGMGATSQPIEREDEAGRERLRSLGYLN